MNKFIPFAIFCAISSALYVGLSLNPSNIPSELINDPVPEFALSEVGSDIASFSSETIATEEDVIIMNFFASWCAPCYVEHPFLMELKNRGYKIYGVAYKDRARNITRFLEEQGNPYDHVGADENGRVGIEFGVYGMPETYIIKNGIIKYKHIGPILEMQFEDEFIPILESARR
jgi:cytochrome c biogenesis protein CcmG/thiol:disulfide interchange protein DsbE